MAETTRGYPYPGIDEAPAGPYAFEQLAEAVDLDVQTLHDARTKRYPAGSPGAEILLDGDGAWQDIATVNATVRGQLCTVDFKATYYNDNSGSQKTTVWRLLEGANVLWTGQGDAPYRAGDKPHLSIGFSEDTTPAAGARVFKLQAYASAINSVRVADAYLSVTEWAP